MAGMHGSTQDRSKPRIQHAHVAAGSMLSEECTAALNLQVRFFSSASAFEFASVYLIQLSADAIAWRHLRRMLAAVVLEHGKCQGLEEVLSVAHQGGWITWM